MKIIETKVYNFSELSETAKDRVINKLSYINVEHDWWEYVYADANTAGIAITEHDTERGVIDGQFDNSAEMVAESIIKDHGGKTDTHTTAAKYLNARIDIIKNGKKDAEGYLENLDDKLDPLDAKFKHDVLENYLVMLRKEYDYLTSRKAIIESIDANEYDFTDDGNLF